MNGPQRTDCFAKEMHSYTLFTLKLYPDVQPEVILEVQPGAGAVRQDTDGRTNERNRNVQSSFRSGS